MQKFLDEFGVARMWQNIKDYIQENYGSSAGGADTTSVIPSGFIGIWSGSSENVPVGWQLCDGTNGTPDLRDKFVLGAGTNHEIGDTGGSEEVTLTTAEMPTHSHTATYQSGSGSGVYGGLQKLGTISSQVNYGAITIQTSGKSHPHNNMPPYYALCYIMKL